MLNQRIIFWIAVISLLLSAISCGGKKTPTVDRKNAQADRLLLQLGNKALAEKHWDEARGHFRLLLEVSPKEIAS